MLIQWDPIFVIIILVQIVVNLVWNYNMLSLKIHSLIAVSFYLPKIAQTTHWNCWNSLQKLHRKIIMSDEAHFHLGGYVNKQNCCIWGSENPKTIIEKTLYLQHVNVWCNLWAGGIIGPYFFLNQCQCHRSPEWKVSTLSDFSKRRLQLAAKIMRFNASRLFSLGSREK